MSRKRFGRPGLRVRRRLAVQEAEVARVAALEVVVRSALLGESEVRRRVGSGVRAAHAVLRRQYANVRDDDERQAQASALSSALAIVEAADLEDGISGEGQRPSKTPSPIIANPLLPERP